jgi:hypothetical protein
MGGHLGAVNRPAGTPSAVIDVVSRINCFGRTNALSPSVAQGGPQIPETQRRCKTVTLIAALVEGISSAVQGPKSLCALRWDNKSWPKDSR